MVVILSHPSHQFGILAEGFLLTPWQGFMEGHFLLLLWMGGSSGVTLGWSPMGKEASPSQASCVAAWTKVRAWALLGQRKEEPAGQVPVEGGYPWGMLSRVDVGAFPSSRSKGLTIIPWNSGGLALRAVPQVVKKARWSLLSSSMASASRCWMP